ncbi:MAG TPA: replicative DNA helicase, partial [Planctomycetota bacterium]|nr:replicative DNA helicase [Planctomycetota bacterium]
GGSMRRKGSSPGGDGDSGAGGGLPDRKLPHNLEAEQSVLGALLVDCKAAAEVFNLLQAEDFYSPRHARVFSVFQGLYDRLSTFDEVMVLDEMERLGVVEATGGLPFLEEIVERVPTAANAEYYARIVREKAILRALAGTCTEVIQGVYESEAPAREQLDLAEQRVFEIGTRSMGRDFVEISEVLDQHFEKLGKSAEEVGNVVPSGFRDLDEMTTGFHPAEFIIVAGRPSMGKTSFCMNVVEHAAAAGKRIAIFSLEVSKDQLVQNLLCSFSKVDAHRVRQRQSLSRDMWQKLIDGASRLSQTKVFIDDTPGLTPLSLKAKARRLQSRAPLDLVVIDYLQLMEVGGLENRQQEISTVSRSLKSLARELAVPVITISQLSRGVENRETHKPRLSDLRESGAIEQDADLVLLLYREEYYKPEKEEARGKAEVIIAKQRNGPTGSVHLAFLSKYMRFENLAQHFDDAPASGGPAFADEEVL